MLVRRLGLGEADFLNLMQVKSCQRASRRARWKSRFPRFAMMHQRGLIYVLVVSQDNKAVGVLNARDGLRALLDAGNYEEALLRNYAMGIGYQ